MINNCDTQGVKTLIIPEEVETFREGLEKQE
jgi:hypothetical protein